MHSHFQCDSADYQCSYSLGCNIFNKYYLSFNDIGCCCFLDKKKDNFILNKLEHYLKLKYIQIAFTIRIVCVVHYVYTVQETYQTNKFIKYNK